MAERDHAINAEQRVVRVWCDRGRSKVTRASIVRDIERISKRYSVGRIGDVPRERIVLKPGERWG